jgi:hypothetical protein
MRAGEEQRRSAIRRPRSRERLHFLYICPVAPLNTASFNLRRGFSSIDAAQEPTFLGANLHPSYRGSRNQRNPNPARSRNRSPDREKENEKEERERLKSEQLRELRHRR